MFRNREDENVDPTRALQRAIESGAMALSHRARQWKVTLLVVMSGTVLWCSGSPAAAADMRAWRWQRAIVPARPAVEQCVVLDGELYARSAPGLRDVRLVQDSLEVPYALEESFDEAFSGADGVRGGAPDRSLFTTVLQIRLSAAASPGPEKASAAVLPARVPVERILFVPAAQSSNGAAQGGHPAALQRFRLVATVLPASGTASADGELIEGSITASRPYDLTAIGANLQQRALVRVAVEPGAQTYSSVVLQMRQRSLCFRPLSSASLQLLFGNDAARPPRYDYASHYMPVAMPLLATLGPTTPNPAYRPARPKPLLPLSGREKFFLLLGVTSMALMLTCLPLLWRFKAVLPR